MKAVVLEETLGGEIAHRAELLSSPRALAPALSPVASRILAALQQRPDYAQGLARRLGLHEQKVYYHVHRLLKAGLVRVVSEERRRGAPSRYLAPVAPVLAVRLLPRTGGVARPRTRLPPESVEFLGDFCADGVLQGPVVVGSPVPHGPFLTAARDGHYAVALGFRLGSLASPGPRGIVHLDTEVRGLGLLQGPLILVGGPVANTCSLELNPHLPTKFDWQEGWRLVGGQSGHAYTSEGVGLVAKVPSPWARGSWVLALCGLHHQGTLAAILGVTTFAHEVLGGYRTAHPFARVVEGFDRDGDGRVDTVAVLE